MHFAKFSGACLMHGSKSWYPERLSKVATIPKKVFLTNRHVLGSAFGKVIFFMVRNRTRTCSHHSERFSRRAVPWPRMEMAARLVGASKLSLWGRKSYKLYGCLCYVSKGKVLNDWSSRPLRDAFWRLLDKPRIFKNNAKNHSKRTPC